MEPRWERLGELEMRVELIVGERDERFRAINERMLERLPRAGLHLIPAAGHAAHLERPAEVAALL